MNNIYWQEALKFKSKILGYVYEILKVYGNELTIKIEELNLLQRNDNCIESSTAIGYCIEEFIVSKLMVYTDRHIGNDYKILRNIGHTQNSSFDCYCKNNDKLFLINIKADKANNNAVSAIQQLYKDYVVYEPKLPKHFMVLKINYSIGLGKQNIKKILIKNVEAYFLEEIDFALGYKQDHRSWNIKGNLNSGRLQINKSDLKTKKMNEKDISYEKTFNFIKDIFDNNEKK